MEDHEIRNELIQFFKTVISREGFTQLGNILGHMKTISQEKRCDANEVQFKSKEIINEFINNNILMWGYINDQQSTGPWLTVTRFGERCIAEENILPYDPEGYIRTIITQVPLMDSVTLVYLKECIQTYNKNCLLSSSVTLGAASENIILMLIDSFQERISNPEAKIKFEKLQGQHLNTKYKLFMVELKKIRKTLPKNLTKDLEVYLGGMYHFIRINRNTSGHPTGGIPNKKTIYSNIQMFSEYSQRTFELIEYFKKNSTLTKDFCQ